MTGVPSGLVTGVPSGFVTAAPPGTVTGVPSGLVTGVPSGLVTAAPPGTVTGVPSGLVTGVPSGLVTGAPPVVVAGVPSGLVTTGGLPVPVGPEGPCEPSGRVPGGAVGAIVASGTVVVELSSPSPSSRLRQNRKASSATMSAAITT